MWCKTGLALALAAVALMVAAACSSAASPTPTPTTAPAPPALPTPTAGPEPTPTPMAAPKPAATPTPLPPLGPVAFSTWENPNIGASLRHPSSWEEIISEDPDARVMFSDPETGASLTLLAEFVAPDVSLDDRLDSAINRDTPVGIDGVGVEPHGRVSLADSTEAMRADIVFARDGQTFITRLQVAQRGSLTLTVLLQGTQAVFERWAEPFAETLDSFSIFLPSAFGVPRESAFVMPLGEPITLDPAIARETTSHLFVTNIFSGLVRFDDNLEVQPDLAERWEVDATGTVYTFTLREGIAFHDGSPITAQDFKYSIERSADPELHSDTASLYLGDIVGMHERLEGEASEVSGVDVVDERTIRITIDAPKEYFLPKLTYPSAAIVDRKTVEGAGEDWWMSEPNGSGPYKLLSWEVGQAVVLKRNGDYHTPPDLEYFVSPNTTLPGSTRLDMYQSYAWDALYVGLSSLNRVREDAVLNAELYEFDQLITYFVALDATRPPFDDADTRRAFGMALDREALIEEVYGGDVTLANGLLPPGMPGYSPSLRGIPYDPERAWRALAQSAYADDFPSATFSAINRDGEAPESVQFMIGAWEEELGIQVSTHLVEPEVYYYQLESVGEQLFTYAWVADYPDPENFLDLLLHSASHISRYANPDFDRLVEQARVESNHQARLALYNQAEQLLIDDAGIIPLFHVKNYVLVSPHVGGFDVTAVGQPNLAGITIRPSVR